MGYGFIQYATSEAASEAIAKLNGHQLRGKFLKVSIARPSSHDIKRSNLYIVGLPSTWTKSELAQYFSQYGQVIESRVLVDPTTHQSRGVGFCRLDSHRAALNAISNLNGVIPPNGSTKLTIKLADNPNNIRKQRDAPAPGMGFPGHAAPGPNPHMKNAFVDPAYRNPQFFAAQQQPVYAMPPQQQHPHLMQQPFLKYTNVQHNPGNPIGAVGNPINAVVPGMQPGMQPVPNVVSMPPVGGPNAMHGQMPVGVPQQMQGQPMQGQPMQPMQPMQQMHQMQGQPGMMMGMPGMQPGAQGPQPFQGVCLFVYHLPLDASDQTLYQIFSPYATVCSTKVMKDLRSGRSKGFGFVNVLTEQDGHNAIQHLNNLKLGNKYIKISFKK